MNVIVSLCIKDKPNAKGGIMLKTIYSCWDEQEFDTIEEARAFGRGIISGLRYRISSAACSLRFEDGHEENFID